MASDRTTLKAQPRTDFGSRETRRLRRSGFVPGVVYGDGSEARAFQVNEREVRNVLLHGGALIDVEIEGAGAVPAVIKEEQRDPVRGQLIHLDLQEVKLDVKIEADVAVELVGGDDAPGVKEGGVLEHVTHQLTIEALPTAIPESIPVDVSGMEINDTLQLSGILTPDGRRVRPRRGPERRRDHHRHPLAAARRGGARARARGGGGARRRGGRGARGRGRRGRGRRVGRLRRRGVALSPFARRRPAEGVAGFLVIGLGNPGTRYARTRHNVGFEVAAELSRRWGLPRAKPKYRGLISEGRIRPGGPRAAVLIPQTYMNESGDSAGPARGALRVPLERVIVVHDEIDLPFGEIRAKLGGGAAGHNGLKSLRDGFGSADFWRLRIGVGRPDSTDPEIVSAHVLGRFSEPADEVRELVERASEETERLIERIDNEEEDDER